LFGLDAAALGLARNRPAFNGRERRIEFDVHPAVWRHRIRNLENDQIG
jgi:hypothetical protein